MRLSAAAIALCVASPATAHAQLQMGEHQKAIQEARIQGAYRCPQTDPSRQDVTVAYELKPTTEAKSVVTALSIRGKALGKGDLDRVNAAVRKRGIESVTVTCSSTRVEVVLAVFRPGGSKVEYVTLSKANDSALEVVSP